MAKKNAAAMAAAKKSVKSGKPEVVESSVAPVETAAAEVSSTDGPVAESVNSVASEGSAKVETANRVNHNRKGSNIVFQVPGRRGTIKFPRSLFGETVPETLDIDTQNFAAPGTSGSAKPKMTKEERAAARAAMTPAQKLEQAKARLAKQTEKLAKQEAALAAAAAAPQA